MARQESLNTAHPTNELPDEDGVERENEQNALHFACQQRRSKQKVCKIVCACPDTLKKLDCDLNTPLHVAAGSGSSKKVMDLLISEYPEGLRIQNIHGKTPLHIFCEKSLGMHLRPLRIVKKMVNAYPDSLKQVDNKSRTPLHFAVNEALFEVIDYLVTKFPGAASKQDSEGRTPLHTMFCNGLFRTDIDSDFFGIFLPDYIHYMTRVDILLAISTTAPVALITNDNFGKIPLEYAIEYGANEHIISKIKLDTKAIWKGIGEAYFKRKKRRTDLFVRRLCYLRLSSDQTYSTDIDDDDSVTQCKEYIPAYITVREIAFSTCTSL